MTAAPSARWRAKALLAALLAGALTLVGGGALWFFSTATGYQLTATA